MKKRRNWLIVGGVVVLAILGFLFFRSNGESDVTYRTEKVDRGNIAVRITATGTLSADTTVQVGSQVSGRISKLYADFNSKVTRGQLLAQLDPTFLQAAMDQARATTAKAKAQMDDAQRTYNRTADLYKKGLASQADMDAATTTLEADKADYQQAQAALEGATVNLRYATIRAPISGIVISRNVDIGQTVAASLQAPTLFTIANDLHKMEVQANIDEADIGNVQVGQEVTFRVDAYPDQVFKGRVSQIRLSPVTTQNVVNYIVIIGVDNPDEKLMPGMTATVTVLVAEHDNVLRVPIQATKFVPAGVAAIPSSSGQPVQSQQSRSTQGGATQGVPPQGRDTVGGRTGGGQQGQGRSMAPRSTQVRVWILSNGKPKSVMVGRGLQDQQYMEVTSGDLKEGDQVIIAATGGAQSTQQQPQNPFGPRMPGGGRRGF